MWYPVSFISTPLKDFFYQLKQWEEGRSKRERIQFHKVFSRMLRRVEGASLICGFKVEGRRGDGECVTHLLFADDTILFCNVDVEQILHIRVLLLSFQAVTGLKVNVHKSEMVPVGEIVDVHALAEILGCKVGELPMSYVSICRWELLITPLQFGILFWKNLSGN